MSRTAWRRGSGVANGSPGALGPTPGVLSGLTLVTGALLEWTVFSLGTRGNRMEINSHKQINEEEQELNTNREILRKSLERHEHLINSLAEFIKGKMNVHGEIRRSVAALGTSFKRFTAELEKCNLDNNRPTTSIGVTQTSPRLLRAFSETTVKDTDIEDGGKTPTGRQPRKGKRKKRTSPEEKKEPKKLRGEASETEITRHTEAKAVAKEEWHVVGKKKKSPFQKATRPDALIIRPKEKEKYADILKRVKQDASANQARDYVDKIRRTAKGDMLIVLRKENNEKTPELQNIIAGVLGEEAVVIAKCHEEELEIKDIDETTTILEILEALQNTAGDDCKITIDAVKSLRKAYGGTQTATVRLNIATANKVIGEYGKIKIGWVNCRIRKNIKPVKCFRCWQYGHLANKCGNEIDRTNVCMKCGELNHKIANCQNEAHCMLCKEKNMRYDHIAGSSRCPVFKVALQMVRNNRPR